MSDPQVTYQTKQILFGLLLGGYYLSLAWDGNGQVKGHLLMVLQCSPPAPSIVSVPLNVTSDYAISFSIGSIAQKKHQLNTQYVQRETVKC